jgi:hypothetical protein
VYEARTKNNARDDVVDVKSSMEIMPIHALVGARMEAVYANISKQMGS